MVFQAHGEIGSGDMGEIEARGGSDEPFVLVLVHDGREPEQAKNEPQASYVQFGCLLYQY